jgi:heme-degrading monooxygenase HmoA
VTHVTGAGTPNLCRMVLEIALIDVLTGSEEEFTAAYQLAVETLVTTPGCRSVRLTRGVESPSRFVLLVEWDSVEAHLRNFRESDRFTTWRGHIGAFFAEPPRVEHFTDVPA